MSTTVLTDQIASVACAIEAYPFEGGNFTMQGGLIRAAEVSKSINGDRDGRFRIMLAPGGPLGIEAQPTWSETITPGSLLLVGMQRGSAAAIPMVGIVVNSHESQSWESSLQDTRAERFQVIEGRDFTWYFTNFNWAAMTFLGLTAGTPLGNAMGFTPAGLPYMINQGLLGLGNPAALAQRWYDFMSASGSVLGTTWVPYVNGTRIAISGALHTSWENYPGVYIPVASYWLAAEGTWMAKFADILPWPWYEFFVTTAPAGAYDGPAATAGQGVVTSGYAFRMPATLPAAPAVSPTVVARVNPTPMFTATVSATGQAPAIGALDMARWNKLTLYDLSADGSYDSSIGFSADDVRNFYLLNPTYYQTMWDNNANSIPFTYYFIGAADPASIHRYGYRPEVGAFNWFADPQGRAGQNPSLNIPQTVATLTARLCSTYEPLPLMAKGDLLVPLRPDILPGFRCRCRPFKSQASWDFYIEAVTHTYIFGGRSTTRLLLSRGLPTSVYADTAANGLLVNVHTGNAQRKPTETGVLYQSGLPPGLGPGLQFFGQPPDIRSMLGDIASVYVTPQKK